MQIIRCSSPTKAAHPDVSALRLSNSLLWDSVLGEVWDAWMSHLPPGPLEGKGRGANGRRLQGEELVNRLFSFLGHLGPPIGHAVLVVLHL